MVHGLEAKHAGKIRFVYLDADDPATRPFQRDLGFRYQPELYLLDPRGVVLKKWVSFVTEGQLEAEFDFQLRL